MKKLAPVLFAGALLAYAAAQAQDLAQTQLPRTTLSVGIHQIDTQLATTQEQHATGLMHRQDMPQQEGMLFIFENPTRQCFWMKNTLLPLTAAFLADDGTIVNLVDMKPKSLDSHCSAKPVRFVLEMNLGWFAKKGIKPGSKISGRPFKKPTQGSVFCVPNDCAYYAKLPSAKLQFTSWSR